MINWEMVHAGLTAVLGLAGLLNYLILMSIRLEISRLDGNLKEWVRQHFVTAEYVDLSIQAASAQAAKSGGAR
jgi:hypothetical protein